jgi:hypothetical protein
VSGVFDVGSGAISLGTLAFTGGLILVNLMAGIVSSAVPTALTLAHMAPNMTDFQPAAERCENDFIRVLLDKVEPGETGDGQSKLIHRGYQVQKS